MEVEGTIVNILPPVNGTSARGQWTKQEVIIDQNSEFNKKLCVSFWGDKTKELANFSAGSKVTISINIESREHNGRWYTEVRAWRVSSQAAPQTAPQATPTPMQAPQPDLAGYTAPPAMDEEVPF